MAYIELPLWVVILLLGAIIIVLIYLIISDLLARIIYKAFKDKDKETKESNYDPSKE